MLCHENQGRRVLFLARKEVKSGLCVFVTEGLSECLEYNKCSMTICGIETGNLANLTFTLLQSAQQFTVYNACFYKCPLYLSSSLSPLSLVSWRKRCPFSFGKAHYIVYQLFSLRDCSSVIMRSSN